MVVGASVVVGADSVVAGASGAAVSGSAVSVAPPEQAETNMLRTRNPATQRFMLGVFHQSRSVSQRESPVEHPCVSATLENHGRPLARPKTTERPEISGLSSIIRLVEMGGIETQKSVQGVRLDR